MPVALMHELASLVLNVDVGEAVVVELGAVVVDVVGGGVVEVVGAVDVLDGEASVELVGCAVNGALPSSSPKKEQADRPIDVVRRAAAKAVVRR
ncbi:hypothetical protein VV02_04710 [Luteipulveratus mongoliensis]|uniref:Uncharacterized protein n=1 Tax=Luteipulveratus mongoliensis TaxID=571913 RepID=A0A0K1JF42_9MICO|nr:hypothetical protein VV02_04710 [Luteipulveratus mongoliensis]